MKQFHLKLKLGCFYIIRVILEMLYTGITYLPSVRRNNRQAFRPESQPQPKTVHVRTDAVILFVGDQHFGNEHSRPEMLEFMIKRIDPDILVDGGDLFDPEHINGESQARDFFYNKLRLEEWRALSLIRDFSKHPNKLAFLLQGDHDIWMTDDNPTLLEPLQGLIIDNGKNRILVRHGYQYALLEASNKRLAKYLVIPVYYALKWLAQKRNSVIARLLLDWIANHQHFKQQLKHARKAATKDALYHGCDTVVQFHFHTPQRAWIRRRGKTIRYVLAPGAIDYPRRYVIYKNGRIWNRRLYSRRTKKAE